MYLLVKVVLASVKSSNGLPIVEVHASQVLSLLKLTILLNLHYPLTFNNLKSIVPGPTPGTRCGRARGVRRGVPPRVPPASQRAHHRPPSRGRGRHRARVRERDQGAPRAVPEEH